MGDEQRRGPGFLQDLLELAAHTLAKGGVEIGERLIEQDHSRARCQSPGQRHPLLLSAGQLMWQSLFGSGQSDQFEDLANPPVILPAAIVLDEPIAHVGGDGQVGEKGVVLKHHPDAAPLGRNMESWSRHRRLPRPRTIPASGRSKPAITRRAVVLPQPDGPSSVSVWPSSTAMSNPASAVTSPNVLLETPGLDCEFSHGGHA